MFETDNYESKLHKEPPAVPTQAYEPVANVKEMSLLFWGEHCVECAAPMCYKSCDFYQARPDMRCRRFAYGLFKNRNFASLRGYGVEVSFKKWAKIETLGNLALQPVESVLTHENRRMEWAKLGGSKDYIERLALRLHRKRSAGHLPEAFLLEAYNPTAETVRLQLNFSPTGEIAGDNLLLGPSFVTTLSFPSGYSRHQVEAARLHAVMASGKPFKISMIPEADNNARLVFLAADFVTFVKKPISATESPKVKCVVWDLDNTLWNGILIEGDNVVVRPEICLLLKQLDERGVLLSIASKNDHASAWQKLQELGLSEYFLYPQINWAPKTMNIKAIAERLNIGLDTFAFVDDNPFELDQVARALPEVVGINAGCIGSLFADARFQGSTSADARHRRRFYQEAMARETAELECGSNYLGFLATCGIALEIVPYAPEDSERVAELVQRTNQLNFSGHQYTRCQVGEILTNPQLEKYVLRSSDKYGSYGTVGFSIVEPGACILQIRDFMLSCRVQGKFIEQAFFHHLVKHHNRHGATVLWVNFHRTERNKPAQEVLEMLGFHKCNPASDGLLDGMVHSSPQSLQCDFIQVHCSALPVEIGETDYHPASAATAATTRIS
jgi:FkbH-like protein